MEGVAASAPVVETGGKTVQATHSTVDDKMIRMVSKRQVKAARALLVWSQEDLARAAGVSVVTVKRLEGGAEWTSSDYSGVRAILLAFETSGIRLTGEPLGGLGVRLLGQDQR